MTRFPHHAPGASVLTGGAPQPAPAGDPVALELHAEYVATVERLARIAARMEPRPEPMEGGECPAIDDMFKAEDRILQTPGVSPAILALKLMALFCIYQRLECDNVGIFEDLRAIRDEAASVAGLSIIDEWASIWAKGHAAAVNANLPGARPAA